VDVVVAYYITTRLFWWYHTMANQQVSRPFPVILTSPVSVLVLLAEAGVRGVGKTGKL
jgi:hypothetical protein